ncbi:MAG: TIR domain-containing protein, partial [Acidobacteriota bacterium]
MPKIPPDLLPRARQILLPLVTTAEDRDALLTEAFYLHDPLLYQIEREGAPYPFAVKCLKKLLDFGCLAEREHSLARLLTIARTLYGTDKHAEIDDLIQITNEYCRAAEHPTRPTIALPPPETPAPLQTIATPHAERRPTVFLSYSHTDADFAHRLIAELRAAGHACWIDTSEL